jgi:hypothetical protein
MMEPGTRMIDRTTMQLRSEEKWGDQIQDFLALTRSRDLETLQQVG